jgi:hypothetical protein
MASGGEGVPAKTAMNALATGQFPIRLNEPLASFLLRPRIFMNPKRTGVGRAGGSSR